MSDFYPEERPVPVYLQAAIPAPVRPGRGLGISGMVLGIIAASVTTLSLFFLYPLTFLLSLVGLPLSISSAIVGHTKDRRVCGQATAGIVLNTLVLTAPIFLMMLGASLDAGTSSSYSA